VPYTVSVGKIHKSLDCGIKVSVQVYGHIHLIDVKVIIANKAHKPVGFLQISVGAGRSCNFMSG
jgi:hypothetical protein